MEMLKCYRCGSAKFRRVCGTTDTVAEVRKIEDGEFRTIDLMCYSCGYVHMYTVSDVANPIAYFGSWLLKKAKRCFSR